MQIPEIKLINYGIACRIGNKIYINENLKQNPLLFTTILSHELEHSNSIKLKDVLMDLNNTHLKSVKSQYYNFIIRNPKTWVEFLPGWFYEGKFVWNPLITYFYLITFLAIMGVISWF